MNQRRPGPTTTSDRGTWQITVRARMPAASVEALGQIVPMHPSTVCHGVLAGSPAASYLATRARADGADGADGAGADRLALLRRWPFRVERPGTGVGSWTCLALLAYEQGTSVDEAADELAELEGQRLLLWSGECNAYAVQPGATRSAGLPGLPGLVGTALGTSSR